MGLWVGAAMDEAPHCVQYEDGGGPHLEGPLRYGVGIARQPWLNVNVKGDRYVNEDLVWTLIASADLSQPEHMKWAIWDEKWRDIAKVERMGSAHSIYSEFHGTTPELTEEKIRNGSILKDDTIEGLAKKMEIPYDKLKATIDRYNELVKLGKDLDFGKDPSKLTPIDKPPYYAAKQGASLLVTLGGLKINPRLQVLDTESNVIPGLYAAGNVSGSFFANDYPQNVPGLTHGRAFTFGRLAGLNAAADKA
jgi:fumarate reductase flavoprotein subunit